MQGVTHDTTYFLGKWIILFQVIQKQFVATSSTHAEIRALYMLLLEMLSSSFIVVKRWDVQSHLLYIIEDNQPVIDLTKILNSMVMISKHFLILIIFRAGLGRIARTEKNTNQTLCS
jgi:hypothetical protein